MRGKIELFGLDTLVIMIGAAGLKWTRSANAREAAQTRWAAVDHCSRIKAGWLCNEPGDLTFRSTGLVARCKSLNRKEKM